MKEMSNKQFLSHLKKIGACKEAVTWVNEHGGTSAECWNDCERGDWMAWLVAEDQKKFGITKQQLVGVLADCAALSLKYYEAKYPNDKRVRDCVNTCRRYAKGKATNEELGQASYAASSAASAASSAYAASAASAASSAYAASAASAASSAYAAAAQHRINRLVDAGRLGRTPGIARSIYVKEA